MTVIKSKFPGGFFLFFMGFLFIQAGDSLLSTLGGAALMILGVVVIVWAVYAKAPGEPDDDLMRPGKSDD